MASKPVTLGQMCAGQSGVLGHPQLDEVPATRLAELGVRQGQRIRLLQRSVGGTVVIDVLDARIALDRATAGCIPITVDE